MGKTPLYVALISILALGSYAAGKDKWPTEEARKRYRLSCEAHMLMVLSFVTPESKSWSKGEIQAVAKSGCDGAESRLKDDAIKKFDPDLLGCFDGVIVGLFKKPESEKQKLFDFYFDQFCSTKNSKK